MLTLVECLANEYTASLTASQQINLLRIVIAFLGLYYHLPSSLFTIALSQLSILVIRNLIIQEKSNDLAAMILQNFAYLLCVTISSHMVISYSAKVYEEIEITRHDNRKLHNRLDQ